MEYLTPILLVILGIVMMFVSRRITLIYVFTMIAYYGNLPWWMDLIIFIIICYAIDAFEYFKKGN